MTKILDEVLAANTK
jgi:carbonic anhydrase